MKDAFSLRTIRKKILMLTKLAGLMLILSYILLTSMPINQDMAFAAWLGSVVLAVLLMDLLMGRFLTTPVTRLNDAAKRMAHLDFSAPCTVSSADELGELSASLNTMSANLQEALARLKDANLQLSEDVKQKRLLLDERKELTDSLSHEMKTPLGVIRAYAEGLQDETDETKKQQYAQVIISEVRRMNDLIVTLLDLSALESGTSRLTITQFDFVELVETVAGRLLADIPDTNFELQYDLPDGKIHVQSDRRRMEQILNNLMSNARKNVRPGGILRLELIECRGKLHFSIFNQGRPIPEDELPRIWTKFYRDSTVSCSGSGLGLSIVAQILSMQKLPYGAENLTDGVRFFFSIPIVD